MRVAPLVVVGLSGLSLLLACASTPQRQPGIEDDDDAVVTPEPTPDSEPVPTPTPEPTEDAGVDATPDTGEVVEPPAIPDAEITGACDRAIEIDPALGAVTEAYVTQCDQLLNRPASPTDTETRACWVSGPFPVKTYHAFIEVRNPSAQAVKAELRLDDAEEPSHQFVFLAAYKNKPTTDVEADNCITGVNGRCSDPTGQADVKWPCLIGEDVVTIPANGSIWAWAPLNSTPNQDSGANPIRFTFRVTVVP